MALEVARRLINGIWRTDVEDSADSGGGSTPSEGGVYFLIANGVTPNSVTHYEWSFAYGTPQLDLTDPQHPAVLAEGVYALTVAGIMPAVYTPGSKVVTGIDIDTENNDAGCSFGGVLQATVGGTTLPFPGAITFYSPAGNTMLAQIAHDDATSVTLDFFDKAYVQKIA